MVTTALSTLETRPSRDFRDHESFPADVTIVAWVLEGDHEVFEVLMRRYNQRLFRVAMSLLGNEGDAEDLMQETYVRAYRKLRQWQCKAAFSTWLIRIAVYEGLRRRRKREAEAGSLSRTERPTLEAMIDGRQLDPERRTWNRELARALERAVEKLSERQRLVFTLREIERLSTRDTAECLSISRANVKVTLLRAKRALREELERGWGPATLSAWSFYLDRCERVVESVFGCLRWVETGLPR